MKKFLALFLVFALCLCTVSCGNDETESNIDTKGNISYNFINFHSIEMGVPADWPFDESRSTEEKFYYDKSNNGSIEDRVFITRVEAKHKLDYYELIVGYNEIIDSMNAEEVTDSVTKHQVDVLDGIYGDFILHDLYDYKGRVYLYYFDNYVYAIVFMSKADNLYDIAQDCIKTLHVNDQDNNEKEPVEVPESSIKDSSDNNTANSNNSSSSGNSSNKKPSSSSSSSSKPSNNSSSSNSSSSGSSGNSSSGSGSASIENDNALKSAKNYLSFAPFSHKGLMEQLEFEGYSSSAAKYAADNCGANWNEQAAKSARNYLDIASFSRQELIEQLKFGGFTQAQAEYGVKAVGY